MKIAIDARWIFDEISGIGNYTFNLIRSLISLDRENTYLFLFDDESRRDRIIEEAGIDSFSNCETVILPYGLFSLRNQLFLNSFLKKNHVDIYHSTNYMAPLFFKKCPIVLTIHDIIPLKHPEYTPKAKKTKMFRLYSWIMRRVVKRADIIIADSEHTRNDILSFFDPNPEKVQTIYPAIDMDFMEEQEHPEESQEVDQNYTEEKKSDEKNIKIAGKLIIYVGRQDPYKNILTLAQAFRKITAEEKIEATLLVIGPEDERYPDVHRFIRQYHLNERILFSGYVSKNELRKLYKQANLLVLPSRYEGFGLPVLEAFSSGTPVITSNASSLPEVVGDAGILIDPDDVSGFANAIERVLTDIIYTNELVEKGYRRLNQFSWEKSAREILEIYEKAGSL